jgi:hypothetical protein
VEKEERPLRVAVLVDTSEPMGEHYRLQILQPLLRFLGRLPKGTEFAVWTTGDRPNKVVDYGQGTAAAAKALGRIFPTGGNTLLDALVEASRDLQSKEAGRSAIAVVTGTGAGFTNYSKEQVVDIVRPIGATVLAAEIDESSAAASRGQGEVSRTDYDYTLANLADGTGGRREILLSAMGVEKVPRFLRGASSRPSTASPTTAVPGLKDKDRKVEVKVARPGAKIRIGYPAQLRKGIAGRYAAPSLLALLVLVSRLFLPRADAAARDAAPSRLRDRHRGHQPQRLRHRRPRPLRHRPHQERLRRLRGRREAGALDLQPRGHPDLARPHDRHLGLDGREAAHRARRRHPLRGHLAAPGQRPGHAVQRPHDDPAGLRGRTRAAGERDLAHGGGGADRAPQRPLRRPEGAREAEDPGELRRRAIVLLSDGEDTASLVSDDQVLDLARKTEINIYAISLRPRRMQDRNAVKFSQAAHLLTALTQDTGGQVHFPNSLSELDAVYDRIAEELRTQYSLGYVSNNGRRDGKWRRIVVRVPTREELQVRHKLGYFAVGTTTTSR